MTSKFRVLCLRNIYLSQGIFFPTFFCFLASTFRVMIHVKLVFLIFYQSIVWGNGPNGSAGQESACQCRRHRRCNFHPWVRKIPCRRAWQPTPVFLLGKSHGQRSLVGYNPQDCKGLDTTEQLSMHAHNQGNSTLLSRDWFRHGNMMRHEANTPGRKGGEAEDGY